MQGGVKKFDFFTPPCIGDRKKCFRTDKRNCKSFYERICRLPEGSPKQGLQLRFPKENYGCNLVLSLSQKVIWTFWEPYTTGPVQSGSISVLWMGEEQQSVNVDICKANTTIAPVATKRWRLFVAKRLKNIEKSNKMRFFNKINTLLLLQTA